MNHLKSDSGGRRNTLGYNQGKLEELLDRLDACYAGGDKSEDRNFSRWPLRTDRVEVTIQQNGLSSHKLLMASRNVSNTGVGLLHSSFLYPGSKCSVAMPTRSGGGKKIINLQGTVMRCVHVEGMVHEIGISFDEPIDASQFVAKIMSTRSSSDKINPATLKGTVLYVEDSDVDFKLIEFFLSSTGIELTHAASLEEARAICNEPYNLILCDLNLPDGQGSDLVHWMRDQCVQTPIAIITATPMSQIRQKMQNLEIQGVLNKPIDKATVYSALSEFMNTSNAEDNSKSRSTLDTSDPAVAAIIESFKAEILSIIESVQAGIESNDAMGIYTVANRLHGTASALGYSKVGEIAGRTAESLAATMSCEESRSQLDSLIASCQDI